ncbi:hypothetical protein Bca101_050165 [Brassica carinata]|uniref:Uncharacterized protein n=1 Tax=Brassica oleracea TaxID=3712 RepID=A0A3P6DJJ3_BRAOL|nr:unnamed protein product [Brassica oleracea]
MREARPVPRRGNTVESLVFDVLGCRRCRDLFLKVISGALAVFWRPINPDQSLLNAAVFVESFTALLTCEGKPNGENSSLLLADLKGGRCRNTVEVRLPKFWEDRNVKKRGELMGVDMLIFA